jgi:hypothetical protein
MPLPPLSELIGAARERISEIETVYATLASKEGAAPAIGQIALPFAYRCFVRANAADERVLAFMGQYLCTQYPSLADYFATEKQREHVRSVRTTLDEFFAQMSREEKPPSDTGEKNTDDAHGCGDAR